MILNSISHTGIRLLLRGRMKLRHLKPRASPRTPVRQRVVLMGVAEAVTHSDMRLSDAVLHVDGITATDDVLNPVAPRVNEVVGRRLADPRSRRLPFAYAANKMFNRRLAQHVQCLDGAEAFLEGRGKDPSVPLYTQMKHQNDTSRRTCFGVDVLIATG
ncbi:hypothetical protein SAMN05444004_101499 [Jannaschia faecimaris]|uniref:Uncharacterized protein n=1 Tax=Jannaschia faecimaris TaxID=1244108 RepID=A0A1H3K1X1_9RHOB|nr:hypothetical protein [Jannaschia faecimaris]SDY46176.1 hypothetical protein SAMN05444004_101499 [Jannaschia faecimaris]